MRLLLDTHTLIWCVEEPVLVGSAAMSALQDSSNRYVSAATIWEFAAFGNPRQMKEPR